LADLIPGQIVIVDWRDALPKEPNKLRPAIVIEDTDLFGPDYPNVILVPLSQDQKLAIRAFSLGIDPTASNGCPNRCYALSNYVAATSKQRLRATESHITVEQLELIREQIALAIGLDRGGSG
jgi:mRNA interferase MazF